MTFDHWILQLPAVRSYVRLCIIRNLTDQGSVSAAAGAMGIHRNSLHRALKYLQINPKDHYDGQTFKRRNPKGA